METIISNVKVNTSLYQFNKHFCISNYINNVLKFNEISYIIKHALKMNYIINIFYHILVII